VVYRSRREPSTKCSNDGVVRLAEIDHAHLQRNSVLRRTKNFSNVGRGCTRTVLGEARGTGWQYVQVGRSLVTLAATPTPRGSVDGVSRVVTAAAVVGSVVDDIAAITSSTATDGGAAAGIVVAGADTAAAVTAVGTVAGSISCFCYCG